MPGERSDGHDLLDRLEDLSFGPGVVGGSRQCFDHEVQGFGTRREVGIGVGSVGHLSDADQDWGTGVALHVTSIAGPGA